MTRQITLSLALWLAVAGLAAAADLNYTVYGPYFESNKSGLKGDEKTTSSYVVVKDQATFDKYFGHGRVMKQKPNLLPKGFFDKNLVLAAIKRGDQIYAYDITEVKVEDGVVLIKYMATAKGKPGGSARFASPLIVGIPRGDYKSVEFKETRIKDQAPTVTKVPIEK